MKKGESVKAGDTVTVRISSGAGDVPIPDVAGYKSSEAQKMCIRDRCPCIPASKIPWGCTNPVGSNQWREGFRRNDYAYG